MELSIEEQLIELEKLYNRANKNQQDILNRIVKDAYFGKKMRMILEVAFVEVKFPPVEMCDDPDCERCKTEEQPN